MGNFQTFRADILSLLQSYSGDGKPIAQVVSHYAKDFSGYPAVAFEPSDVRSDFETTASNLRLYAFSIFVVVSVEDGDHDAAIHTLLGIVDTLIDAFDKSAGFNGDADYLLAVPMEPGFYAKEGQQVRFAEIKVTCGKSVYVI